MYVDVVVFPELGHFLLHTWLGWGGEGGGGAIVEILYIVLSMYALGEMMLSLFLRLVIPSTAEAKIACEGIGSAQFFFNFT
jgi:hypothetical protein